MIKREKFVWTYRHTDRQTDRYISYFCLDRQILPLNDFKNRFLYKIPSLYTMKTIFAGLLFLEDSKNVFGMTTHL